MSRQSRLYDLAVCLTALAFTGFGFLSDNFPRSSMWFGLVMSIALWWRRTHPLAVLAVIASAALG